MATKKSTITKAKIVSLYMDYRLENNDKPKSVYQFSKTNGFTETEFYFFLEPSKVLKKKFSRCFWKKQKN